MSKISKRSFSTKFYGLTFIILIVVFAIVYYFLPNGYIEYNTTNVTFINSLYFSIVTITTLGFGDILPKSQSALALVSLESILGVVTIGFYLNSVSAGLSKNISEIEKSKEENKRRIFEIERILRYDKLFQINLKNYIKYAVVITTPFHSRTSNEIDKFNSNFVFNDLSDLYKMSLIATDKTYEPAIIKYYKYEKTILENFKHIVTNFDIELLGEIEDELLEVVQFCIEYDFSDTILGNMELLIDDVKASEHMTEMIRDFSDEPMFKSGYALNPYIALYFQLKSIDEIVIKYDEQIDRLIDELNTLKLA